MGSVDATRGKGDPVGVVLFLIILAVVFGGIGLLVEGLMWLFIIALVLVVAGAVTGMRAGRRS